MVKIKGSKDGTLLKARFEGQAKSLFPNLKKTKALVLLSIKGNQYCTGRYLKEIIDKAVSEFEFTTFLIADEVYWHNLCQTFDDITYNKKMLKKKANLLGADYLDEHLDCFLSPLGWTAAEFDSHLIENFPLDKQKAINKAAQNYEVVRWRDWINKSEQFSVLEPQLSSLYQSEPVLSESVHEVASDFVRRRASSQSKELLLQCSSNYLIEESPAVMWIAAQLGYNFVIYPGDMIASFSATRDYFIKNGVNTNPLFINSKKPELLANWLNVSFIRSRSSDSESKYNKKRTQPNKDEELTQWVKGITQGIFSLGLEKKEKIDLITDIMIEYQKKSTQVDSNTRVKTQTF